MQLSIQNLSKLYTNKTAINDLSINLTPGITGLLGPNGAGKSTFMKILAGIEQPSGGTVTWNGASLEEQINKYRKVLGYLPQDFGVYPNLTPIEFLQYIAALKGLDHRSSKKRIEGLLEQLNLHQDRKRPIGGFSGGMKQRVGIAQALLNDPSILIVDEPTVGLDPHERMKFRDIIQSLSEDRIVILSTHIVSDVESISDNIAILANGSLEAFKSPQFIIQSLEGKVWSGVIPSDSYQDYHRNYKISSSVQRSNGLHLRILSDQRPFPEANLVSANLEDAYLLYTGGYRK
ncbi:ABC transporter ATP-binding protein [Rossellomorea marisflavi]|uniref:ABC transporter ATP-binding protein n=1 Tax=Rossellomorea marisflavi TaxID=189381 RepID=A0A0M0G5W9_9BACI|nr:ABC transporter ATP-binding protein [Rossellomorea marisflavi]KON84932.1 ABC transporter ATP-binding protein [Rossellomorea marisflavi]MCM2587973.1 ABC transporter ATP-binding protein [Rossellomorea marisflavi]TYS54842.1 ABC transporter ATP-binding protein [Rossellomorea marisflavi]